MADTQIKAENGDFEKEEQEAKNAENGSTVEQSTAEVKAEAQSVSGDATNGQPMKEEAVDAKNISAKPTTTTATLDGKAKRIVEQVEYYFGNINLPRDKFLQGEMKKEVGWVPLTTMLKFNRLSKLSEDVDEIASALRNSSLLEVSDSGEKIRRSQDHPLPENTLEYWQEIKRRTVYVKGFPQEVTLDEIMQFMRQFGTMDQISLRNTKSVPRIFKGSIFAIFADKGTAETFANSTVGKEYKGQPLTSMMQDAYWNLKNKERKEKKQAEKNIKQSKKAQTVEDQKQSLAATHFVKGIVLKVTGYPQNTEMIKLKDFFRAYGDVGFVAISNNEAHIRFNSSEENFAQKIWEKAQKAGTDGKVVFNECTLAGEVLGGDEEQNYWMDFHKSKIAKAERDKKGGKSRGGGGKQQKGPRGVKRPPVDDANVAGSAAEKKSKRIVFKEADDDGNEAAEESKPTVGPATDETKSEEVKTNGGQ